MFNSGIFGLFIVLHVDDFSFVNALLGSCGTCRKQEIVAQVEHKYYFALVALVVENTLLYNGQSGTSRMQVLFGLYTS